MKSIKQSGILLGAVALCATPVLAQSPTKLLGLGDAGWAGFIPDVGGIFDVDVNDSGDWVVEADGGSDTAIDLGIVHNGVLIFQESMNTNMPASHAMPGTNNWSLGTSIDTLDINDNGEIMFTTDAVDLDGVSENHSMLVWRDAGGTAYVLLEEFVTLSDTMVTPVGLEQDAGAVWGSITEAWQNNNNQIVVHGSTSSGLSPNMYVFIEHDGAGTILSQTVFAQEDTQHDVDFGGTGVHLTTVQGFSASPERQALNNNGEFLYYIDDEHTGGGDTNADSHVYLYAHAGGTNTQLLIESDLTPVGTNNAAYEHFSSIEVDLNDSGSWIGSMLDDGPSTTDGLVMTYDPLVVPTVVLQEGTTAPGAPGVAGWLSAGFSHGQVSISDTGDTTYFLDWTDPDTTIDTGIFRNTDLVVQEGDMVLGGVVTNISSTASTGMACSDNGRFIAVGMQIDGVFGYYLFDQAAGAYIDSCNGDGGNQMGCTNCPCGNNAVVGTIGGCLNSALTSSRLLPTGVASIMTDSLHFNASGLPANAFSILNSGDAVAPTNPANPCFGLDTGSQAVQFDGLRCAVTNTRRHGGRSADANGDIGITNNGFGPPNGPMIGFAAQSGWVAGQTRNFQLVNRDDPMLQCMRGLNTSQAVTVTYVP